MTATGAVGGDVDGRGEVRAVYIISVAAELAGVHPQTLRAYERKGLLKPARTAGGPAATPPATSSASCSSRSSRSATGSTSRACCGSWRCKTMWSASASSSTAAARPRRSCAATPRQAVADALRSRGTEIVLYRPTAIERHTGSGRR